MKTEWFEDPKVRQVFGQQRSSGKDDRGSNKRIDTGASPPANLIEQMRGCCRFRDAELDDLIGQHRPDSVDLKFAAGPLKNSLHAIALVPSCSPVLSHSASFLAIGEPRVTISIRMFVST